MPWARPPLSARPAAEDGELRAVMEKQGPGNYKRLEGLTVPPSLSGLGLTTFQSPYWQKVAGGSRGYPPTSTAKATAAQTIPNRNSGTAAGRCQPVRAATRPTPT